MRRLRQVVFEKVRFDDGHSIHLHTRPSGPSKSVAVFIHGLNGSGYGTWKKWPEFIFEGRGETTPMDVAVYDYPSLLRAVLRLRRGADIDIQAHQLSEHLQELSKEYEEIYLIAHSLGGLVAEAAVSLYLQDLLVKDGNCLPISPIAAMFMMASPLKGSGKALLLLSFFRDVKRLRLLSKDQARYGDFFHSYVQIQCLASEGKRRFIVPRYAAIATHDVAVSSTSASESLPEDQRKRFTATHFSVVKPRNPNAPQHVWLLQSIWDAQEMRAQWYRNAKQKNLTTVLDESSQSAFFVTQLEGEYRESDWDVIYNRVRVESSTSYVEVVDCTHVKAGTKVDLRIAVNRAAGVIAGAQPSRQVVLEAVGALEKGVVTSVGICSVGEKYSEATSEVRRWLSPEHVNKIYVDGVDDDSGIGAVLKKWIDALVHSHPIRQIARSQQRVLQLNYDAYEEAEEL
ncbi:alpha/beta hydrolase [Streptomyces sp. NPDC050597]|uniref:alpha/beta hydrolase n=1 Tax=Streptomyces sp. NPDC050597 TaxID=3157212 RepID=UPI003437CE60